MISNIAAYHFYSVPAPDALAAWIRERAERLQLRGSVLVAPEGVNLFLAGPPAAIDEFVAAFMAHTGLDDLKVKYSRSEHVPFARLKVKLKSEIIAFRQPDASPLAQRAPAVSPATLRRWIEQGSDDQGKPLLLLDTRNREEFAHGSFHGAVTLPIDNFTDLPAALDSIREQMQGHAVVSFCTGGIRCEKAALWMQAQGLPQVAQLDGGILGYFESEGGLGYDGSCFVFDERIALRPDLSPVQDAPVAAPAASAIPERRV